MTLDPERTQFVINIPDSLRRGNSYQYNVFFDTRMKKIAEMGYHARLSIRFVLSAPFLFTDLALTEYEQFAEQLFNYRINHPVADLSVYCGRVADRLKTDYLDALLPQDWINEVHPRITHLVRVADSIELDSFYGAVGNMASQNDGDPEFPLDGHHWNYFQTAQSFEAYYRSEPHILSLGPSIPPEGSSKVVVKGEARHAAEAPEIQRQQPIIRTVENWNVTDPDLFGRNVDVYATNDEHLGEICLRVPRGPGETFKGLKSQMQVVQDKGPQYTSRVILQARWYENRTMDDWFS